MLGDPALGVARMTCEPVINYLAVTTTNDGMLQSVLVVPTRLMPMSLCGISLLLAPMVLR